MIPLGITSTWCSTIIFITDSFLHICTFFILPPISLTFPSFPSKELSVGMSAKGKAFGVYRFFFQLAAAHFGFWEVHGISNTPRITSPLGKSHNIVFNLALSCSGFPILTYFPLFLPYSLHFLPKNSRWEAFGFDRFWTLFQLLGELGGSGSCSL